MNGLILAAGKGTRLKHLTRNTNKCLLKINNDNRLIDMHINRLIQLSVKKIIICINHKAEKILAYVKNKYDCEKVNIEFLYQNKLSGIVAAIDLYSTLYNEDFILILADEYYELPINKLKNELKRFKAEHSLVNIFCRDLSEFNNKDAEIAKTFSLNISEKNDLVSIREKPKSDFGNLQGIGLGFYKAESFKYLKKLKINKDTKQLDLDGWINKIILAGYSVSFSSFNGIYTNINTIQEFKKLNEIHYN
jgi:dTDP-glucose pyrophosphorylase